MTRDNPSIATNVNTITSSVIILSLGNARLNHLCHRLVRQTKTMDSGATELFSMRTCPVCIEVYFQSCSESPPCPRDLFKPKSKDHKVMGSKPVLVGMLFVDFPVSGVVRAKQRNVEIT